LKFAADIATGKKEGSITLKFVENAYTKSILDGLGDTAEVFFITDKDKVLGLQTSVTDERESTRVSISPIKNVNGDLGMIELKLTYLDDYSRREVATDLETGFVRSDIPTWTSVQFGEEASTSTSLSFYVQDSNEVAVNDITAANVTLRNVTDDADVSILTPTLVGNVMTLTFASLTGKEVKPLYAVPTLETDLYRVQKTFTTLIPA